MSQTKLGAIKMKQRMIERHGSEEAYREYMRNNARIGGKAKVPKGFATMDPERLKQVGSKGGSVSKRKSVDKSI